MLNRPREIVLSYEEAMRVLDACERILSTAKFALQDLRCGLAGRAAYRLESLLKIEIGENINAAQSQNAENITSLEDRRVTRTLDQIHVEDL